MDILKPFSYPFFQHGAAASVLVGALCGLLGVYVVLRGMSYIGHGLSHAIFAGAAVALAKGWNFYAAAGLWGFVSALMINQAARRLRIAADAAIGIVTTASFAVGIMIISSMHRFTRNIDAVLFGSILGVTDGDLIGLLLVTVLASVGVFVLYKPLLFTTFDQETARVFGVRTEWIDAFFSLTLAASIIMAMNIIGVTLIAALIVLPPMTARLLTDRLDRMLLLSMGLGSLLSFLGIYLSYWLDTSSGATIVLTQTACFLIVVVWNTMRSRNRLRMMKYRL